MAPKAYSSVDIHPLAVLKVSIMRTIGSHVSRYWSLDLSFPTRMRPSPGYCQSDSSSMSYKTIEHALKRNIIDFSHEGTHHMGRRDDSLSSNSSKGLKGRQHNHTNARCTRQMHISKYTTGKYQASPKTYLNSKLKQYQP